MLRFLHTADWHLTDAFLTDPYKKQVIDKLASLVKENNVDFVLCVGDVFDKPHPKQEIKDFLLQKLIEYKTINWIFIVGNHDYTTKAHTYHSLRTWQLLANEVKLLENVRVFEPGRYPDVFGRVNILVADEKYDLSFGVKDEKSNRPTIVAYHGILPGYEIKYKEKSSRIQHNIQLLLNTTGADYFALGDIHKHQQLHDRCWYPGALIQKTYACEEGMVLVEIDGVMDTITTESLHLDLPKKINLPLFYDKDRPVKEEDIVHCVKQNVEKGNLVRLAFSLPIKVYAALNKEYIKAALKDYCLDIKFDNEAIDEYRSRENMDAMIAAKTIEEELDIAIKEGKYSELDPKKLKKVCKDYVR